MTLKVNINLLQDNNGIPGEAIAQDQILVNDSFFVEVEVADLRENAAGVIGLALDVQWDATALEALDTQLTDSLPLNPQGTIDNDNGLIDDLGAGAIPNFNLGEAIGINELERFALLHFKGELVTGNPIPLNITVSDPGSVAFADGTPFAGDVDIEIQTLEITPPPNTPPTLENSLSDIEATEDTEFSFTIPENTFNDADEGDTLTYTATLEDDSDLPEWLTFDAETQTFNGTPANGDVGSLEVKVTVTDNSEEAISDRFILTVENVDDAPVVQNETADLTVEEDAADTIIDLSETFSDIDNDNNAIAKTISANGNEDLVTATVDGDNLILDYQNNRSGNTEISIQGESNGKTVADTFSVTINPVNDPPIVSNPLADVTTAEDSEFSLTIPENTFNDVDTGDSLTYTATLGDGSDLSEWLTFDADSKTFSGTPVNSDVGSLEVKVTATDSGNEMTSDIFTLTVENVDDAPVVQNEIADLTVEEDAANTIIDLSETFSDIDNDDNAIAKTISSNGNEDLVTATVDGDNLILDYQNNRSGSTEITIQGNSNGQTVEGTFSVTVNPVDDLPVVQNAIDDVEVNENAEDSVIDLSNAFSDADGDEITLEVKTNSNEDLVTTSLDGTDLTLDFLEEQFGEAEITVEATANGEMVSDTFKVKVNEVTPENTPPTLVNEIGDLTTAEDSEFSFTIPDDTFQDIDKGDSLTYSAMLKDGSDLPDWLIFDADTKTFSGTPNNNEASSLDLKVTVTDNDGATASDRFSLTVENVDDAPVVSNEIADLEVDEDADNSAIALADTFSDIDNDNSAIIKTVLTNSNEDLATASIQGNELTLDYQDNKSGTAEITIKAESNGKTVTDTFEVKVNSVDDLPVVSNPISNVEVNENAEDRVIDLSNTFVDADGDEITLEVKTNSNEDLVTTSLDNTDLTLDFLEEQFGEAEITVEAIANGEMVFDTFNVTVNEVTPENTQPTLVNEIGDLTTAEDSEFSFTIPDDTFQDLDKGDSLTYFAMLKDGSDLPDWLTFDADTKTFSGTPANSDVGSLEVKVTATDNDGETASNTFTLTVENVDDLPFVSNPINNVEVNENAEDKTIDLSNVFSDADGDKISLAVKTNSNEDLVTTTLDGTDLTLDFLDEQFGEAEITIEATANGEMVFDTFSVNVNEATTIGEYSVGGEEADVLNGTKKNDSLFGGEGDDSLFGGEGDDFLIGLIDNDLIAGEQGNDLLVGYHGDDSIRGGQGNDTLLGNQDNDTLSGGGNEDMLSGGLGNDILFGGLGNDTLYGGKGSDIFVLELDSAQDLVGDFANGIDRIGLTEGIVFEDLNITNGDNAQIIDSNNNILMVLSEVNSNAIALEDFITL